VLEIRRADGSLATYTYDEFEVAVRAGHVGPDAQVRFPPVTGEAFVAARELEAWRSVDDAPRTRFQRRFDLRRPPWVTLSLTVLLAGVFAWQVRTYPVLNPAALVRQGAKSMAWQVELGQWWRLVSASLLHSSWLHLVPNLLFLLYVGWNVEAILGGAGMALLLAVSATGSMAASSIATDAATVGASGMTFGVFGAAVALGWRFGSWLPPKVRSRYGWPVVPFVAWFLITGITWKTVDNFCHAGGLLAGGTAGMLLPSALAEKAEHWPRRGARIAAAVGLVAAVGLFLPLAWNVGLLPGGGPRLEAVTSAEAGWSLQPPRGWTPLGSSRRGPGWRSDTGQAQLTVRASLEELEVPAPEAVRLRWLEELEESGEVVPSAGPDPVDLGLTGDWFALQSDVVADGEILRSLRLGTIRGLYVTTVEFVHPVDRFDDYGRLRTAVLGTVQLEEPRAVVRALEALHGGQLDEPIDVARALDAVPARVAASPADALRLAAELARYGEGERAGFLLEALASGGSTSPEIEYWRLWIAHHLEGGAGADGPGVARELAARQPDSLPAAALCFDVLLAADRREEAAVVLDRMRERWPERLPVVRRAGRLPQ